MMKNALGSCLTAIFCVVSAPAAIAGPVFLTGAKQVAAGSMHACALLTDTSVACWGNNYWGQLGNQYHYDDVPYPIPVYLAAADKTQLTGIVGITAGAEFSCALQNTGAVFCWGRNQFGQLGRGAVDSNWGHPFAQAVPLPAKAIAVVAQSGSTHVCALLDDAQKTLRCWGKNWWGQLGDGSTDNRASPVEVKVTEWDGSKWTLAGVRQVTVGASHSCAILSDMTAACWGSNSKGQLGNDTPDFSFSPTTVVIAEADGSRPALGDIATITGGAEHTCVSFGSTWSAACWGSNIDGQLGVPEIAGFTNSPVGIRSLGVKQLSAGYNHTCAVLADGRIACWGGNKYGQIGDGTSYDSRSPVVLTSTALQISSGYEFSCAVMTDTNVNCWGDGSFGELGLGSDADSSIPQNVLAVDYSDDRIFASNFGSH